MRCAGRSEVLAARSQRSYASKKPAKRGTDALKLDPVNRRDLGKHGPTLVRQAQFHAALVCGRARASDQPLVRQAIDEAHGAVVPDQKLLRQVVDGGPRPAVASAEHEHGLIGIRRFLSVTGLLAVILASLVTPRTSTAIRP